MIDAPDPFAPPHTDEPAHTAEAVPSDGSAPTGGPAADDGLLDQLEADLAAVDTAIETIERIAAEGTGGERAAAEIRAAVSPERFDPGPAPADETA